MRLLNSLPPAKTTIRLIEPTDAEQLASTLGHDKKAFARWQPIHPAGHYTPTAQATRIERLLEGHRSGQLWPGVVLADDLLIGEVSVRSIVREPFRKASLGYWIGTTHQQQGHGGRAVGQVLQVMAGELGLHRAEASTQLENIASQRILRSNGFTSYGIAHSHIFLNDEWHDGVQWEKTLDDA